MIKVAIWALGVVGKAAAIGLGYVVEIEGKPNVRCKFEPTGASMFDPGLVTAMPAVHAIPLVCAAAPGIVTADRLPMIVARNCVPR